MKTLFSLCVAGMLATAAGAANTDGVKPGEFTMDLDAAKEYAAKKKLPILLDFSGSDWCGWCQLMDANVFEKPEWRAYAADNVVMVLLDFPKDKSRVPAKYVERNKALKEQYGVTGFPTFVVLDSNGETELGRLKAGREKTPASFQAELEHLLGFTSSLTVDDKSEIDTLTSAISSKKAEIKDAKARVQTLAEELAELEGQLKELRIALRGGDSLKEYQALQEEFDTKLKALQAWIATNPEKNEENNKKFQADEAELKELQRKLAEF